MEGFEDYSIGIHENATTYLFTVREHCDFYLWNATEMRTLPTAPSPVWSIVVEKRPRAAARRVRSIRLEIGKKCVRRVILD